MSTSLDGNESQISSILFPTNILINDSIGIIEVNEEQISGKNKEITNQFDRFFYDDQNQTMISGKDILLSSMEEFNYSYFMNNNQNKILSSFIKDEYQERLFNELSANIKNENGYAVYYENPINLNVSSNFIQINDNIYIVNKNLFNIKNNAYINNDHILNDDYKKIKNILLKYYNRDTKNISQDYTILHNIRAKMVDEEKNISGVLISGLIGDNLKSSDIILTGYIINKSLSTPLDSLFMKSLALMNSSFNNNQFNFLSSLISLSQLSSLNLNINKPLIKIMESIKDEYPNFYQNDDEKFIIINDLLNKNYNISDKWIKGYLQLTDDKNKKQVLMIDDIAISFSCFDKNVADINDKTVPIYDFSNKELEHINLLKPINEGVLSRLIQKYKSVLETYDPDFESKILYNSEDEQLSTTSYDSILIKPLFEILSGTNECSGFFKELFSILPVESFYRFLNLSSIGHKP